MEGGKDLPEVGEFPLENIEEDLNKLYLQTVIDAGSKGTVVGPGEVIEDFAIVIGDRIASGNEAVESASYVLSSAVILTIVQSVFDVGASIKDINLQALKLHQIKQNIELVEKKIDKMMIIPLKVASVRYKTAFNEIKAGRFEDAQKSFITLLLTKQMQVLLI